MKNQGEPAILGKLVEENKKFRKQLRHKALARKKNELIKNIQKVTEENEFLEELNKNFSNQQPSTMKFYDKKS